MLAYKIFETFRTACVVQTLQNRKARCGENNKNWPPDILTVGGFHLQKTATDYLRNIPYPFFRKETVADYLHFAKYTYLKDDIGHRACVETSGGGFGSKPQIKGSVSPASSFRVRRYRRRGIY